ncbi:MAG: class IV adenylate cyclase [bacterium]
MEEIEVKIIGIDRRRVEEKLVTLGAKKIFDGEMHATYYDFPDKALGKAQDLLRLRKEGDKSVLVFKKFVHNEGAKVRREYEVSVSDFNTMQSILEGLGFSPWLVMRKHRVIYQLQNAHVDLDKYHDEYDFIPDFLEIEAPDIETIHQCARLLGFGIEDCKPWTAVELAEHYRTKTTAH